MGSSWVCAALTHEASPLLWHQSLPSLPHLPVWFLAIQGRSPPVQPQCRLPPRVHTASAGTAQRALPWGWRPQLPEALIQGLGGRECCQAVTKPKSCAHMWGRGGGRAWGMCQSWGTGGAIQEATASNRASHSGLPEHQGRGLDPLQPARCWAPALPSAWQGQVLEARGPLELGAFQRGPWAPSDSSSTSSPSPRGLHRSWHCHF